MTNEILYQLSCMASGECRWIEREDIHAYCRAPLVETMMPWGRPGWTRGPVTYCVVCPEAGLDGERWLPAKDAAALIKSALAGSVPAAA